MVYEAIIPARNEEKYLEATLLSLKRQSVSPGKIIVIDDGSTDKTFEIAERLADTVVRLKNRGFSALGTEIIPKVFNKGLEKVSRDAEFVLVCGADVILPSNYAERILHEMKVDHTLVISSGRLGTDPNMRTLPPRGTRVVRAQFWRNVNGLRYPESLGWESWLVLKAQQLNLKAERIPELIAKAQRKPLTTKKRNSWSLGRSMSLLGYHWIYALGRSGRYFLIDPKVGVRMIAGYLSTENKEKLDVAAWVNQSQRKKIGELAIRYLKKKF